MLFSDAELAYLAAGRLGRLATVGVDGAPHVVPTMYHLDAGKGVLRIGQRPLEGRGQQRLYVRHAVVNPRVAFVVDDVVMEPAFAPRGVSVKGTAVVHPEGGEELGPGMGPQWLEIRPVWAASWGIDTDPYAPVVPRTA